MGLKVKSLGGEGEMRAVSDVIYCYCYVVLARIIDNIAYIIILDLTCLSS